MLTEPDLQARYLAATLNVIETEIQKLDLKTNNRRALAALVAGATRRRVTSCQRSRSTD